MTENLCDLSEGSVDVSDSAAEGSDFAVDPWELSVELSDLAVEPWILAVGLETHRSGCISRLSSAPKSHKLRASP